MENIQLWNYGLKSLLTWKLSSMIESRMGKLKKTEDNSGKYKNFRPKLGDTFPRWKQEKNNTDGRTRTLDFGWV